MKRVTAAIAIALSAAIFSPAGAQVPNLQFQTPLNYRFSVQPRSHVFSYNRRPHHHHGWHHRHRRHIAGFYGPAVIYQNGEIGVPPPEFTGTVPAPAAQPVVYRLGETGSCNRQQLNVPGSKGRTTVNVWRC
jgi:hypothetical protein